MNVKRSDFLRMIGLACGLWAMAAFAAAPGPERAAESLALAIPFQTISYQDPAQVQASEFLAFHRYLEERFPLVHRELQKETVNGLSLLFTWPGSDPSAPATVFCAHLDVVPIAEGTLADWSYPPFSGTIAEGFVWGRGTMDDKGSLIAVLEAAEWLLGQGFKPRGTIYFAFGQDEEVGGGWGAIAMAELLASRGVRAELVIDEGGFVVDGEILGITQPMAAVGIAEKGYLSLELVVKTEGGHSSMPPANTAVGILAAAVARVEAHPFPAHLTGVTEQTFVAVKPALPPPLRAAIAGRHLLGGVIKQMLGRNAATSAMIRTTTAATIFSAGTKENVLPQEARAVINFRLLPGDTVGYVTTRVTKLIADPRVEVRALDVPREASAVTDLNSAGYRRVTAQIAKQFPEARVAPFLVLGGTDARHYAPVSDVILRFMPLRAGKEDQTRGHGTDERVGVDNYREFVEFYAALMRGAE